MSNNDNENNPVQSKDEGEIKDKDSEMGPKIDREIDLKTGSKTDTKKSSKTASEKEPEPVGRDIDALYTEVYAELKRVANNQLKRAWSTGTISTTALVNETYLKLANLKSEQFESKNHFFAIAATAMRQIIINYAEQKNTKKRGKAWQKVTFYEPTHESEVDVKMLLLVNDALDDIRLIDQDLVQLIELRFFAGLTEKEIAKVFQINERTVRRNWQKAKMLLKHALQSED